ncbi:kinase C [Hyphodiscus hymeniophilus]|uniref:Kinase C n=1 Tax=Hyphodiscus hymeniophilus TaxID=353542 RepID=A0A9P6VID5_9HELO|nr:kinase C [Hyphodiscus hymeniophilus]
MNTSGDDCGGQPGHAGDISKQEAEAGILPSHGISIDVAGETEYGRPPIIKHLSTPAYQSPLRHHRRNASQHRAVKETLNARSEYTNNEEDGKAEHHINQYIVKDEIGRGSFGAVHLAVDQYGKEYAVKEFSKSRLRKRAQSNILRRPREIRRPGHLAAGNSGFNAPLHRHSASDIHKGNEQGNSLYLIKEEIAIMKKLNHPNLVSLIEVLDDPEEDSLYMVLEMCKKGVVMKVGLGEKADPYDIENCRCWFRDLVLGIEYRKFRSEVVDDVLKIVDFGVSEMFEKQSEMLTAKSAGSPAFLPPELCVTKHGDISGKAADIWSMGISLYCLRFGRIPFERSGVLELYEAIRNEDPEFEPNSEPEFVDLMRKLLDKDPKTRITMAAVREHPWVTKNGTDPLLSAEENTADLVEPPSDIEVNHAITVKMRNLIVLMKAVKKFKGLIDQTRPAAFSGALGKGIRTLHTSHGSDSTSEPTLHRSRSVDIHDRRIVETALTTEGVHHDIDASEGEGPRSSMTNRMDSTVTVIHSQGSEDHSHHKGKKASSEYLSNRSQRHSNSSHEKGHAHDPLGEAPLFLGIGSGGDDSLDVPQQDLVAESPTAAEFNIYDTAYQDEVERIRSSQGHKATVYLTRRVDSKKEYKADENMINAPKQSEIEGRPAEGFKGLLDRAREAHQELPLAKDNVGGTGHTFSDIAAKAVENTKAMGKDIGDRGGDALGIVTRMAMEKRTELTEKREEKK